MIARINSIVNLASALKEELIHTHTHIINNFQKFSTVKHQHINN